MRVTLPTVSCLCAILTAYCTISLASEGDSDKEKFFVQSVVPILEQHCYDCHSHAAGEANGGLVLDSLAGMQQGGTRGSSLAKEGTPAEQSLLLRAVLYEEPELQMPPEGKIDEAEIEVLRKWIQDGAHVPAAMRGETKMEATDEGWKSHWAYQPILRPKNSIDELLLAKLREQKLDYSPRADRRILIRRAYYNLIGLPPTESQTNEFLQDERADRVAFENVVDELLQSPHFGERWARYWMDISRYSDNKGYVFREDREYKEAYKYRDWLIQALNDDLPYDRFVQYQLAADLIEDTAPEENLPALGFLTLGRRFLNNKQDIIDDRLDVISRGLMGMTLTCARCHDHKYDPISTEDYYSLYGVLLNTKEPGDGAWPHRLQDTEKQQAAFVLVRGNPGARGDKVQRRFISFMEPSEAELSPTGSGRLELAQKILAPSNPLTARVIANRVWMHLMGQTLVETPSDFGIRCPEPQQLEVLDELASSLVEGQWSLKSLIRKIVLTDCFAQTSLDRPAASAIDPANELYWRMNRRRLDFEALRDTLLQASGQLDPKQLGPSEKIETQPFSKRRTVYAYIDRQNLPGLFRTFDLASPDAHSPGRSQTTVPQQGLFLLNSPFVAEQATALAEQVHVDGSANEESLRPRIDALFASALGRRPTESEAELFAEFVVQQQGTIPELEQPTWVMGFAKYSESQERISDFAPLPTRVDDRPGFQGGEKLPDEKLGWCLLTPTGGHPGNDLDHAVVRRWIAPKKGTVRVRGKLKHPAEQGDGVRGSLYAGDKLRGQWSVHHGAQGMLVRNIEVQPGATIDFVTDCLDSPSHDSFEWEVQITYTDGMQFNSVSGFPELPQPALDVWAQAAQALLLSNELIFID